MLKIVLIVGVLLFNLVGVQAHEKEMDSLDNLVKKFEANPADPQTTIQLLRELKNQGKPNRDVVNRYFQTQKEADYLKDYNWSIIRDYVDDVNAPQIKYLFNNQSKFMQNFSKDDVFQKLDNVFVGHLEQYYNSNKIEYNKYLDFLKSSGYEHYDVVADYFYIKQLRAERKSEDGALEIMNDVSRLKVIQLWAGKTVESKKDFDALYNYALISNKCGFEDVAKRYAKIATSLAEESSNQTMMEKAKKLLQLVN